MEYQVHVYVCIKRTIILRSMLSLHLPGRLSVCVILVVVEYEYVC